MDDHEFDAAAIGAVLAQAGLRGWGDVNLVEAAQDAGLDLGRMRERLPNKLAVLARFGVALDRAALQNISATEAPRERLFDMLMNRFETLQAHRPGIMALLAALPRNPATALFLSTSTLASMQWLLDAAGVPTDGITGTLRVHGLMAVWSYGLRAWERDDSADLSSTMAALDKALDRALQAERSLPWRRAPSPIDDTGFETPEPV